VRKLLYAILLLLFFSCKDDNTPTTAISFTWPANVNKLVVVSDKTGKVLNWSNFANGEKISFTYSIQSGVGRCNVTLIDRRQDGGFDLKTYVDVPPGDYFFKNELSNTPVGSTKIGKHIFKLDRTGLDKFVFLPQEYCGFESKVDNEIVTEIDWDICAEQKPVLFAWIEKPFEIPRYILKDLKISETTELSLSTYNKLTEMKSKQIAIPAGVQGSVNVFGKNAANDYLWAYFDYFQQQSTAIIYYPDISSYFPLYWTSLYYFYLNDPKITYSFFNERSQVETAFGSIDVSLSNVSVNSISKLSATLTGNVDYVEFFSLENELSWAVYAPFSGTLEINLPQFSAELLKEVDLSPFKDQKFDYVDLVNSDDPDLDDYDAFTNAQLKTTNTAKYSTSGSTKRYNF
jgi:hypothetical protein